MNAVGIYVAAARAALLVWAAWCEPADIAAAKAKIDDLCSPLAEVVRPYARAQLWEAYVEAVVLPRAAAVATG